MLPTKVQDKEVLYFDILAKVSCLVLFNQNNVKFILLCIVLFLVNNKLLIYTTEPNLAFSLDPRILGNHLVTIIRNKLSYTLAHRI